MRYYYVTHNGQFLGYVDATSKAHAIAKWNKENDRKANGAVETIDPSDDIGGKDW